MKMIRRFLEDLKYYGQGELRFEISLWHVIAIVGIIVLTIYTCNK